MIQNLIQIQRMTVLIQCQVEYDMYIQYYHFGLTVEHMMQVEIRSVGFI